MKGNVSAITIIPRAPRFWGFVLLDFSQSRCKEERGKQNYIEFVFGPNLDRTLLYQAHNRNKKFIFVFFDKFGQERDTASPKY